MRRFRFYLVCVMVIAILKETSSARNIVKSYDAVTAPSGMEDFYIRIKREISYTYVDDGDLGQLRQEDYTGIVRYETYRKLKRSTSFNQRQPEDSDEVGDLEDKSLICHRIFGGTFFEMRDEKAVRFGLKEKKIIEELRKFSPDVYDDIYGGWPEERGKWLNPYQRLEVHLSRTNENFEENVFRCVTRKENSESYTYQGYFISAIYRSWVPENIMNGRFIFTFEENNKLKLVALAEEPALVDDTVIGNTHSAYYSVRHDRHPEPQSAKNPVCMLPKDDKIRLCAAVLGSPAFKGKIKFYPTDAFIEPECVKRRVLWRGWVQTVRKKWYLSCLRNQLTDKFVEMTYDEWMIGCKFASDENSSWLPSTFIYYISRGRHPRTAIVFQQSSDNVFVPIMGVTLVRLIPDCGEIKPIKIVG